MAEDMTYEPVQTVARLAARVQELERELADMSDERAEAIVLMIKFQQERDELRAKLSVVQVYARGIYGEVPPLSFDDWYALVRREVQP